MRALMSKGHAEELGRAARHGLGDGADTAPARQPVRQRRAQPPCRSSTTRTTTFPGRRASRDAASASTSRLVTTPCTCTTCISGRRSSSGAIRRADSAASCTIGESGCRRSCSATSTNGCVGWPLEMLSRTTAEHRPARTPAAAPDLPGRLSVFTSRSHLLRRIGGGGEGGMPRTRRALMASDHLPLVADLRVEFPAV